MWAKLCVLFYILVQTKALTLINDEVQLELRPNASQTDFSLAYNGTDKITGQIGVNTSISFPNSCDGLDSCTIEYDNRFSLTIEPIDSGFKITWIANSTETEFLDCLDLQTGNLHWYGGPEKYTATWPVESDVYKDEPYFVSKKGWKSFAERYWLNSIGGFAFVDETVPLYLDQNNLEEGKMCFKASFRDPYTQRSEVSLVYNLVAQSDPKEAHLHAVNNFLNKPQAMPEVTLIKHPIWTTWAEYKTQINDDVVVGFATEIADHGYVGQIEIDDFWETCYGALTFNDKQFAKINETVQTIKDLGFTITIWTHPFVNEACTDISEEGRKNDYFIKSVDGDDTTDWWEGNPAHHIDFTKEEARKWYVDRLKLLQEKHGIDSFKFDAGESDYAPANPVLQSEPNLIPNIVTSSYVRTTAEFGGLREVRSGFRTQDLGSLVRQGDKDSSWSINNGIRAVVSSLLLFNINGYVFVLPDMIGGNGYGDPPSAELIARWAQANTFMPTMQFSYLPWNITSDQFDNAAIVKKFVDLHAEYSDVILAAMNASMTTGAPVNPPIWWVDPANPDALSCSDQYLLGDSIVVAPVLEEGATSRNVIIPRGFWIDGNNGTLFQGPTILTDYPAPIDVLPYFVKDYFRN